MKYLSSLLLDSYLRHYRGYRPEFQNVLYDVDMCVRIGGGNYGVIDGNSFSDCTVGVYFDQSDWNECQTHLKVTETHQLHTPQSVLTIIPSPTTYSTVVLDSTYGWFRLICRQRFDTRQHNEL